jgi:dTDP-4-amino-4,6-dideoxygalactose transaminase
MSFRIPLSELDHDGEEAAAIARVLERGWLSMGPEVLAFEQEFADALNARHAVAVSSGTAALHLAFLALGVGPGDEIVQPAMNFVAAANMTVAAGATPVFADILGPGEPTLDPDAVAAGLTPRTKAVVTMHHGGYPSRVEALAELCRSRGVALIEDACHAVGAPFLRDPGPRGDALCFSFFSNKNLATGEGGMLVTGRDEVAARARLLRSHGMTAGTWERHRAGAPPYGVAMPGFNYRLDELRAALGRAQLGKLAAGNAARGRLVAAYRRALGELPGWTLPFPDVSRGAHHLMVVVAPGAEAREHVARALAEAGVQTSRHYPCVADLEAFQRRAAPALPRSRAFAARTLTLPLHPRLTVEAVAEVCALVTSAARSSGACG